MIQDLTIKLAMEVVRPFVNILLFIAFMVFFGRNSLEKYLKGDVVINRNVNKTVNISQPGIMKINEVIQSVIISPQSHLYLQL